jgi:hypothetical protein
MNRPEMKKTLRTIITHKEEMAEANAHLIAAAPDLLKACEAAMTWAKTPGNHGGNPYCHDFIKLAEQAIAKTKGE